MADNITVLPGWVELVPEGTQPPGAEDVRVILYTKHPTYQIPGAERIEMSVITGIFHDAATMFLSPAEAEALGVLLIKASQAVK